MCSIISVPLLLADLEGAPRNLGGNCLVDYRLRDDRDLSSKTDLLRVAYENQFPYFMINFPLVYVPCWYTFQIS